MPYNDWTLTIGEIVAPFGRIGEVKVRLETDFPDRFKKLKQVCLRLGRESASIFDIENARIHKGQALLKLKSIEDITGAETLRNALVQIRPDDAVILSPNEFYIHDLIGCEVALENGRILGKLTNVLRYPANDVYVVGEGKAEILLPAIQDVVRNVDLKQKVILVTPTPGLLPETE